MSEPPFKQPKYYWPPEPEIHLEPLPEIEWAPLPDQTHRNSLHEAATARPTTC